MLTHSAVAVSRVLGRGVTLVPEQKPRELPILEIFGIGHYPFSVFLIKTLHGYGYMLHFSSLPVQLALAVGRRLGRLSASQVL